MPDLFFKNKIKKKTIYTIKQEVPVCFHYIWIALKLSYNKGKLHKTLRLLIQRHNQFLFLRKGFGNSFPTIFVCDFSTKVFLMLDSINWPNLIAWLLLFLEILGNKCIAIVYEPGCNVINSEINLVLIKPFWYMIKMPRQKLKYLENEKSF